MKCPNCGSSNGKTNKFCRACGFGLQVAAAQHAPADEMTAHAPEDVELGERLFDLMQILERGDIDAAIDRGREIKEQFPDSTSAHSIMALIYERKAEGVVSSGDVEGGRAFFRLALTEFERVIDLNPDSPADREKLAALRMKLAGRSAPKAAAPKPIRDIRTVIRSIPPPALAGGIVFILLLMLLSIVFLSGGRSGSPGVRAASGNRSITTESSRAQRRSEQPAAEVDEGEASPNALKIYTFPSGGAPITSHQAQAPAPKKKAEIPPARISNNAPELTIVPERRTAKPAKPAAKPKASPSEESSDDNAPPAKPQEKQTGSSELALAIQYHSQGMSQEAMDAISQAKTLFQADVSAGKNVDSAKRGISLAAKYAKVWGQSSEGSSE